MQNSLSQSSHYQLHRLGDDVYAAIAITGEAAISNAGLIHLGHRTLVFDTFLTPQAARDLAEDAVHLTGKPPELVVNSHYHNDHIWGNQTFSPSSEIFSSITTRRLIETKGLEEYHWYQQNSASEFASAQEKMANAASPADRQEAALWLGYYQGLVEAFPSLRVSLPDITFENEIQFHGVDTTAQLTAFKDCHTASDAVLYLPEAGILFMGDLLFVDNHPYLAEGDPVRLLDTLAGLARLPVHTLVPGHGRVGTPDDLQKMMRYIDHCLEIGRQPRDEDFEPEMPEEYRGWGLSDFYQTNVKAIWGT